MNNMNNTGQYLTAISSMTLRGLIKSANECGITRERLVTVLKEEDTFILLYYREGTKLENQ